MTAAPPGRDITFVVTSLHGGGAEAVGRAWMGWLASRGHRVRVLATSRKQAPGHLPEGVQLDHLVGGHAQKVAQLRRELTQQPCDVVLAMQSYPNLVAVAAATALRRPQRPAVLVSERNLVTPGLVGARIGHRAKHQLTRMAYPRADRVIAISHPVAAELLAGAGVSPERCVVVANPAAALTSGRPARRGAGGGGTLEVVLAHRMVRQKRPLLAVAAVAELVRRGRPARLVLFGDGPLAGDVDRAAREAGVELEARGWVEDWTGECSEGSVHLLASAREGFGNVLVEAAVAGIPSVAVSGALGVADALVPGITGQLALESTPTALADALEEASRLRLDADVVGAWAERFSLRSSGTALEKVIEGAVSGRRAAA
ncbi:glycosyltransferase family 4 protein [Streptomyces sp. NP160]|uniref:glycosyltransferase family 4 protein n=1 Tax=Streptomyces sp. NP160 TaxID=2586637 RepID=UPI0011181E48|nr:glycosyltransferase family 4 protein [Streptomyces sp. NP160]TNM61076.1 glycosyltransferase family 4 protein [Streptomyces sp. NP160]